MDTKKRLPFTLYGDNNEYLGNGIYYPHGGNCQVWLESSGNQAWQISQLGDVLLLDGVLEFRWVRANIRITYDHSPVVSMLK